jgi:hypothetical protein
MTQFFFDPILSLLHLDLVVYSINSTRHVERCIVSDGLQSVVEVSDRCQTLRTTPLERHSPIAGRRGPAGG